MGDMIAVVGQVGCGKTTFIQSVMHETVIMKGKMEVKGSIAYVEEEPFIMSASGRKNIRGGKPFNQE